MYTSELIYEGGLRTIATHSFSGTHIFTDAPLDNHGKAESFSPTDLAATALASCMITVMGIEAEKLKIDLAGSTMTVQKTMAPNPRRIVKIGIVFHIATRELTDPQKALFEHAAHECPVAKSLHPDIEQDITFNYPA